jgi:hypothetical protein
MGMNLFFQAFTQQEVNAMEQNHALVNQRIQKEKRCSMSTDIGTAWDILHTVLSGVGFRGGKFLDDVLWNGCEVLSVDLVKEHAARLSSWTPEKVLEGLRSLGESDDLAYHLEAYQEEDGEMLLEEFTKLVAFYRQAADQGLAVVHYAA